jgi:hypothetical protein
LIDEGEPSTGITIVLIWNSVSLLVCMVKSRKRRRLPAI